FILCPSSPPLDVLHSFPTRRSSDLGRSSGGGDGQFERVGTEDIRHEGGHGGTGKANGAGGDGAAGRSGDEGPGVSEGERGLVRRSEEHTSELQSLRHLVCRLLLEKK